MHADGEAAATQNAAIAAAPTPTNGSIAPTSNDSPIVSPEPAPVSPLGYAGITALIGIAAGMLLSPWLERGYKLVLKKSGEAHHGAK